MTKIYQRYNSIDVIILYYACAPFLNLIVGILQQIENKKLKGNFLKISFF